MTMVVSRWLLVLTVASTFTRQTIAFIPQYSKAPFGTVLRASSSNADGDSAILPPIPTEWQGEVLSALSSVMDPDLNQDIVTLGFVKNLSLDGRDVSFNVELTTPACPVKQVFEEECHELVKNLPWTQEVNVKMTAQESHMDTDTTGMAQIGAIIAVSSCKGGVGKSTTAVNLAFALQSMGADVGIFDADVFGPSLPTMVEPDDDVVRFVGRQIAPLQRNGVRLMSMGYVNEGMAAMRGAMVTQLLEQFLSVTNWGSLDYLILDMPPGTGDVQLTLTQKLNITAAVIVTTPQELSFADVERGVEMFDSVNVPCVAVVENMAYYQVEKGMNNVDKQALMAAFCKKLDEEGALVNGKGAEGLAKELVELVQEYEPEPEKIQIFGKGHKQRLAEQWGIEHTYSMPLMDRIAANGDSGKPFFLDNPDSPQAEIYKQLASAVVSEVAKAKFSNKNARPGITYDKERHTIKVDDQSMSPASLRRACRCAACVEELTGKQILLATDVSEDVAPFKMAPCGNYALSVDWSDGHRSLYPYRQIWSLLEAKQETRQEKVSL